MKPLTFQTIKLNIAFNNEIIEKERKKMKIVYGVMDQG
jgi:hypothetical protein